MLRLRLAERVMLRRYDSFYAYNAANDEFYELDYEAFNFLKNCDGRLFERNEFVDFLLSEGLVEEVEEVDGNKSEFKVDLAFSEEPSLRYLLVNVTYACNLRCEHCYVYKRDVYMDKEVFTDAVDQFSSLGGLKIIISGGEPLLHPQIWEFLSYAREYPQRIVLLTNGYLIKKPELLAESVDEVQISLDGLEGHVKLRKADYRPLFDKIKMLKDAGLYVSVSTMVTKYNIGEFETLSEILQDLVDKWVVDVPTTSSTLLPPLEVAAEIVRKYGFGDAGYTSKNYACGSNLATLTPEGNVVKCGFFDEPVGNLREGLEKCWEKMKERYIWKLSELECLKYNCGYLESCRGGCRYRALVFTGDLMGCDPVMCLTFGKSCNSYNS